MLLGSQPLAASLQHQLLRGKPVVPEAAALLAACSAGPFDLETGADKPRPYSRLNVTSIHEGTVCRT